MSGPRNKAEPGARQPGQQTLESGSLASTEVLARAEWARGDKTRDSLVDIKLGQLYTTQANTTVSQANRHMQQILYFTPYISTFNHFDNTQWIC